MNGAVNCRFTELGMALKGVTVIWPDPGWPAAGMMLMPLVGPRLKSGILTVTKLLAAVAPA